jgi:hypothetical protein
MTLKAGLPIMGCLFLIASAPAAMAWQSGICSVTQVCRSDEGPCKESLGKSVSLRLNDDGVSARLKTSEFTTTLTVSGRDEGSVSFEGTVDGRPIEAGLDRFGTFFFARKADGVTVTTMATCRKVAG